MDFLKQLLESGEFSNNQYETPFAKLRHLFFIQSARSIEVRRLLNHMNDTYGGVTMFVSQAWINRFSSAIIPADGIRDLSVAISWFERFPGTSDDLQKLKVAYKRMMDAKYRFEDDDGEYDKVWEKIRAGQRE